MNKPQAPQKNNQQKRPVSYGRIVAFFVLLGAGFRLYGLGLRSLWYDEGASLFLGRFVDLKGSLFNTAFNTEPPVNTILVKGWYSVVSLFSSAPIASAQQDFWIRLWPCFWGVLGIVLVYRVGRLWLQDQRAAGWAALLFAVAPFQIYYAQELRIYTFFVVLGLFTLGRYYLALHQNRRRDWVILTCCYTLLLYTHFIATWYLLFLNLYFFFIAKQRKALWKGWILTNSIAILLSLPSLWMAWRMQRSVWMLEYPWYDNPTWKTPLITLKNFVAGYAPDSFIYWPLLLLALSCAGWGVWSLLRVAKVETEEQTAIKILRAKERTFFLVWMTFAPILACTLYWGLQHFSFYEHRLFILSGALFCWLVGMGMASIRFKLLRIGVALAYILLSASCLMDLYNDNLHPLDRHRLGANAKVDFRALTEHLEKHSQPGDLLVHPNHFTWYSLQHYLTLPQQRVCLNDTDRETFVTTMGHPELLENHGLRPTPIAEAVVNVKRIWFVESHGITFEYKPLTLPVKDWLETHWRYLGKQQFDGLEMTLFVPR